MSDRYRAVKEAAKRRGAMRTEDVRARVRSALKVIEQEIRENDGIYPHRNGALSSAEVARRASIHPTSLFTRSLSSLGEEVRQWLDRVKAEKSIGTVKARRSLVDRISDWKRQYECLLQAHRDTELLLHQTQHELTHARGILERLEGELARLREESKKLDIGKVVSIATRSK